MGLFGAISNKLANVAGNGLDDTMLLLIFQDNEKFRGLALHAFEKCANKRGLNVDMVMIYAAEQELNLYPKLKIGDFLDAYKMTQQNVR